MNSRRIFNGMCRIGGFVYSCGGIDSDGFLDSCERYDIKNDMWHQDVPALPEACFSQTLMVVKKVWIYSFGGLFQYHN